VVVDLGFLRAGKAKEVVCLFGDHYDALSIHVGVSDMFLDRLAGISDAEQKCKIIGAIFIKIFDTKTAK